MLLLASLLRPGHSYRHDDYETRLRVLLDGWEFPGGRARAHGAQRDPRARSQSACSEPSRPSQIYEVAHGEPLEAVALGGAIGDVAGHADAADAARRWLSQLRHVKLAIDGDDLLDAGMRQGPEIGRRLRRALMRKLDGELTAGEDERDAELARGARGP